MRVCVVVWCANEKWRVIIHPSCPTIPFDHSISETWSSRPSKQKRSATKAMATIRTKERKRIHTFACVWWLDISRSTDYNLKKTRETYIMSLVYKSTNDSITILATKLLYKKCFHYGGNIFDWVWIVPNNKKMYSFFIV